MAKIKRHNAMTEKDVKKMIREYWEIIGGKLDSKDNNTEAGKRTPPRVKP